MAQWDRCTQNVAVAEAAMMVDREGRVIRNAILKTEAAEPLIGQVQLDLLAQAGILVNVHSVLPSSFCFSKHRLLRPGSNEQRPETSQPAYPEFESLSLLHFSMT